jgi:hypothetical protein
MKNKLWAMTVFSVIFLSVLANAKADAIPYSNDGTENINLYTFTATSDGTIGGYFYNETAGYTNTLSMLVNGVVTPETAAGVLNNHASSMGDFVSLGSVHAGDILTFRLNVVTTGETMYSDKALNTDGINHVYSAAFSGDAAHGIPAGTYVGFEDLRGGGDFDYNDETFVFTHVVAIPEPEAYAMLLIGLGVIGSVIRRRNSLT